MNASLIKFVQDIRRSYWFLPTMMVLAAIVLAFVTTLVDSTYDTTWLESQRWLRFNQTEGARATLTTIAGSMITVAGVTFSMTMVAVSFASAQFGPRLIGNFMRDRGNQLTLGTFIATFIYSLLVLRSVRSAASTGGEDAAAAFVPQVSVLTAIVLALASVAVLIYFIHHVPETINIGNITARLGAELKRSVETLFPEELVEEGADGDAEDCDPPDGEFAAVEAEEDGYLQAIDQATLLKIASDGDVVVRIQFRPGDFVVQGSVLAEVRPASRVTEALTDDVRSCFACGRERTETQDTLFLVDQLVEILVRALSPGLNDPFTATNCMDWLRAALHPLLERELPRAEHRDGDGKLCVVANPISFERLASHVFDSTRQYVAADVNAAERMMAMLAELALASRTQEHRRVLADHAAALATASRELLPEELFQTTVAERYREVEALLAGDDDERERRDDQSWLGGSA